LKKKPQIDHLGPLETISDGYKYVLVVIDAYTKFVWLFSTNSTDTKILIALKSLFTMFSYQQCIISDRDTAFSSCLHELHEGQWH